MEGHSFYEAETSRQHHVTAWSRKGDVVPFEHTPARAEYMGRLEAACIVRQIQGQAAVASFFEDLIETEATAAKGFKVGPEFFPIHTAGVLLVYAVNLSLIEQECDEVGIADVYERDAGLMALLFDFIDEQAAEYCCGPGICYHAAAYIRLQVVESCEHGGAVS